MNKKIRISAAVVMTLAYAVYAVLWITFFTVVEESGGTVAFQTQSGALTGRGKALLVSEGTVHLVFLLESWYTWFRTKDWKQYIREMCGWLLLVLLLGACSFCICRWLSGVNSSYFFEPVFMMGCMAVFNLIIVRVFGMMDKTAEKRKRRYR